MPLQATSGAASYDAFGGGVAAVPKYIEEYFSTFLYTGNAGTQTVTNGIDLSTKGGMVWIKSRSGAFGHNILDTARGFNYSGTQTRRLNSSTTDSEADSAGNATQASPLTDGFSVTTSGGGAINFYNASGSTYTSWSWAKAPKFFDIQTWTGDGVTTGRTIAHSLGSAVGAVFVKCTSNPSDWPMWHNTFTGVQGMYLNTTDSKTFNTFESKFGNGTTVVPPTSTVFTVGFDNNVSGRTYVAYLFAHNAGGFGVTGTDNVVSCGSFSTDGSGNATVSLGYEPQWLLIKSVTFGSWWITDTMRGMSVASGDNVKALFANTSGAESNANEARPNATGFTVGPSGNLSSSDTFIYIAIRRGPMKVPTSGTSVFNPVLGVSTAPAFRSSNFNSGIDSGIEFYRPGYTGYPKWASRLTGATDIATSSTAAEVSNSEVVWTYMNGYYNSTGYSSIDLAYMFRRAPSFFDEVCYTGTGSALSVSHNLGVTPELIIAKKRSGTGEWCVSGSALPYTSFLFLQSTDAKATFTMFDPVTASAFTVQPGGAADSGSTYVAYLFATCAGVSKVGSYTGTGTTLQVNCGFTGGARFVLIKRTDSTGAWYVWDSARGIVAGNDPYLLMNSTAAEVTNTDYVDTYSAGFEISSTAPAAINASGGSFIFLAIA